jgi:hypothetical protein
MSVSLDEDEGDVVMAHQKECDRDKEVDSSDFLFLSPFIAPAASLTPLVIVLYCLTIHSSPSRLPPLSLSLTNPPSPSLVLTLSLSHLSVVSGGL